MQERAKRPSRLVQSVARWAITLGAAGTIVGSAAMYGVLLRNELASSKYNLLVMSAVLLAMAFVLAPFVRRTFGSSLGSRPKPPSERTLLDEMRESPQFSDGVEGEAVPAPVEPAPDEPTPVPSTAARLVAAAYVIFGVALVTILWALKLK